MNKNLNNYKSNSDNFYNNNFSDYVYLPREDSYLLQKYVDKYINLIKKENKNKKILFLDMGTGSGIQSITALKKNVNVVCVDINKNALNYAKNEIKITFEKEIENQFNENKTDNEIKNKAKININKRIKFINSDLFTNIPKKYKFDLIAFNPPYLPKEKNLEDIALYSAKRGCETTIKFLDNANNFLKINGYILLIFSSLASWSLIEQAIKKNLFDYEILEKEHIFFEDIFIIKLIKSDILKKLEKLKIKNKKIKNPKLFAKGKRGYIIKADLNKKKIAIKIKRQESKAENTIENESRILKIVNKHKIGPGFIIRKKEFLIYNFVEGDFIFDFIEKESKENILIVLRKLFQQMYKLDSIGLNKFEMHHPHKHIIIQNKIIKEKKYLNPVLIDFERARFTDDPKNLTQFCDFLIGEDTKKIIQKKNINIEKNKIIELAKKYKHQRTKENFKAIINYINNL